MYANPVTYQVDLLRGVLLDFQQLPLFLDLLVAIALPTAGALAAVMAVARMRRAG
jgi:ABC-2 type transport system permease protein